MMYISCTYDFYTTLSSSWSTTPNIRRSILEMKSNYLPENTYLPLLPVCSGGNFFFKELLLKVANLRVFYVRMRSTEHMKTSLNNNCTFLIDDRFDAKMILLFDDQKLISII
uniref:Uncharacterized protein n=1 Tax=Cacopsylla melanoneura TaxID=428564 RepID=A0A8D8ZBA9_9HEMI